ncbi:aquaporin-like protein [Choiromyces venosus 120613-1]|uniref:Aquaporin-like protein n=1 Tax=Choiromyces venosus 120613-1 TaxID=1336337 RepID=A0A3N4JLC8_9PEZI|nr:aquaporin-like protein [Choiromyces venosus 120613-1]
MPNPRDSQEEIIPSNSYLDLSPNPRGNNPNLEYRLSAFAGRIGGNQRFTVSRNDPEFDRIKRDIPDATTEGTWKELCDLRGLAKLEIWKSGLIEFWGSLLNAFISGAGGIALAKYGSDYSPITLAVAGGMTIVLTLPLFIHAAGPASGGHINSMITIATFTAKLATLPRTIVYVFMQALGSVVGGFLLRTGLGRDNTVGAIVPGCYWAPNTGIDYGQAFVIEFVSCCIVLFIAFGVGLDPRQRDIFGPALGPILIGVAIAILTFITGIMRQGYTGASMNPSRCLGLVAATQMFRGHWVTWAAAVAAAAINGGFYIMVPPYHAGPAKRDEEQAIFKGE